MRLEDYPPAMQRTIKAREQALRPVMDALSAVEVSWSILEGNAVDLGKTMALFSNGDQPWTAEARTIWHDPGTRHTYHLLIVRHLHNFLSAAMAHLEHLERNAAALKRHLPAKHQEFCARHEDVTRRIDLLIELRDFTVHAGNLESVLSLRGTHEGHTVAMVAFSTRPFQDELQTKLKTARSKRTRSRLERVLASLAAQPDVIDIPRLVIAFMNDIESHRLWLRNELRSASTSWLADLLPWASATDRDAVAEFMTERAARKAQDTKGSMA